MNATERARRSDSLYYDTQVTNRRALCDMIANLESDLTESKAENAKLRELVRLMVRRHTPISPCKNIPCGECPVKDECDQEDALMRELGVEVDG